MFMTYSDSAEGVNVTRARALRMLAKHGAADAASIAEFDADLGVHETYEAEAVLSWLGY